MRWCIEIWKSKGEKISCETPKCKWIRAQWNLSRSEFKFDDTRLSSYYENKIGPIKIFSCCVLTLLSLCPGGCLSLEKLNWDSQQGRDLATSGRNKKKFQLSQSCSYTMRKVWSNLNSKLFFFNWLLQLKNL